MYFTRYARPYAHPYARRKAFTLVELLVVIGIIALLVSILMPSLSRAREMAKKTACLSNLRNLGNAMVMYVNQNQYYPGHVAWDGSRFYAVWPVRLRPFLNGDQRIFTCPSQDDTFDWKKEFGAPGGAYADKLAEQWGYDPGEKLLDESSSRFSYGYNDWGAGNPNDHSVPVEKQRGLGADLWAPSREMKATRTKNASELVVLADNTPDGSWDFCIDPENPREAPGKIHMKGANVLFADGHAMWYLQQDIVVFNVKTNAAYSKGTPEWNRVAPLWNIDNMP